MILRFIQILLAVTLLYSCSPKQNPASSSPTSLRFASYNVAMYGSTSDELLNILSTGIDSTIQNVAAVIQNINPDVLVLCEFDYDKTGSLLDLFCINYLEKGQHNQHSIKFPYRLQIPSNTGLLGPVDANGDGKIKLPEDAYGFGRYEGQYAFAILSKYPIDKDNLRSFQKFLWKDLPSAKLPQKKDGSAWYDEEILKHFRLSSKNHVDVPILLPNNKNIHTIIAHPTPPVFDGPEDRNGLRNHDELKLIVDYINDEDYLIDDHGLKGGLKDGERFVIMGDLNADPIDGASVNGAITQILNHAAVNQEVSNGLLIPHSIGGLEHNRRKGDKGDPKYDTSFFGARIDYVLPSKNLSAIGSGVFWPGKEEKHHLWVTDEAASDHLPVWVDVVIGE